MGEGQTGGAGGPAQSALAKAAGSSADARLLSRRSASDGSVAGDASELVSSVRSGAKLGGAVGGGAPGAAAGAVVGAGVAATKNRRVRRWLVVAAATPLLAVAVALMLVLTLLGSASASRAQAVQQAAVGAATGDGLSAADVEGYIAAADSSGVHWALLAAVDRAAGQWAGPGSPPFGVDDLAAFNAALAEHGIDPLPAAGPEDRVAVGYAYGRLFAARLARTAPGVDPYRVDAGAGTIPDPANPGNQVLGVDPEDLDAAAAHEATKNAFLAVLAAMPSTTVDDADAIFDAAFHWAIGRPRTLTNDCGPEALVGTAGDSGVPQPVADRGAPLRANIASWNTLRYNSAGRTADGLRALGAVADIIGVQELAPEGRRNAVRRAVRGTFASTKENNAVPIFWKSSKYALVAQGEVFVFGLRRIESGVSGTSIGPKNLTWVQLRDRQTGAQFAVMNHHIVPTVARRGRPDASNPKRLHLMDLQMDAGIRQAAKLKAAGLSVHWTADWNVDARGDASVRAPRFPYVKLGAQGMYSNFRTLGYPSKGTMGSRHIDYVMSTNAVAAAVSQRIHGSGGFSGSDHRAVSVTVANRAGMPGAAAAAAAGASGSVPSTAPSPPPPSSAPPAASASAAAAPVGKLPATLTVPGSGSDSPSLTLTGEQVPNAAAIIARGKANKVPEHGWVVAIATALQESQIKASLTEAQSDRDSAGMFQQRRPWGPLSARQDPGKSSDMFYTGGAGGQRGLLDIPDWQKLAVAEAAQAVQVSAFPDAYAKWEGAARSIVQQLAGVSAGAAPAAEAPPLLCGTGEVTGPGGATLGTCPATGLAAEKGLTPDALLVMRCGREKFAAIRTFYGVGQRANNSTSDHPSGRGVDLMVSDLPGYQPGKGSATGQQIAEWMKTNAAALGVKYVIFAARIWNVDRAAEGWRPYAGLGGGSDSVMHYDHVHVSVHGNQGTGLKPASALGAAGGKATSGWTMVMPKGSYRVGCNYTCYGGHHGQDFPAPVGTPVVAVDDATVVRSVALKQGSEYVSYGNLIVLRLKSDPSTEVYYAHLSERLVQAGATVREGQTIAKSGNTGDSSGPHVHLGIFVDGNPTDPMPVLRRNGVNP